MNAEDWYGHTYRLSDFGRAHPEWRIPLDPESSPSSADAPPERWAGCLDPAIPAVFAHRLAIFTEVADRYDIDGIEFDFRRWCRMISSPRRNYAILTRLVAVTRAMLDETARRKAGRGCCWASAWGLRSKRHRAQRRFPASDHYNPTRRARTWVWMSARGLS